jgi:hypothetical protein
MITDTEKAQITAMSEGCTDFYASVTFLVITRLRDLPSELVGEGATAKLLLFTDDTARTVIEGAYTDLNAWLEEIPIP